MSTDLDYGGERPLHVSLLPNPSHLDAQDPVACGKTRAKQLRSREGHYSSDPSSQCGDKVGHEFYTSRYVLFVCQTRVTPITPKL